MSLFSKILVGIVATIAIYCLWPRSPSLEKFAPEAVAAHEARAWQAIRQGNGIKAAGNFYAIYDWQYRFNPVRALNLSRDMTSSIMGIMKSPDEVDQERFIPRLIEVYTVMKRDVAGDFDSAAAGRAEFLILTQALVNLPEEQLARGIADQWGGIFNMPPQRFERAATLRAKAMLAAFGGAPPGEAGWQETARLLEQSWESVQQALAQKI